MKKQTLPIIQNDPWLKPYESAIVGRHEAVLSKEKDLTNDGAFSLSDFATGYLY